MKDDRLTIPVTMVASLLAAQCPDWANQPIVPLTPGGWNNRSFRLGADKVVRLPAAARYAHEPRREAQWMRVLAGIVPVAIPVPLFLGAPGAGYPFDWTVKPWIDGAPLSDPSNVAQATDLARVLRALHSVQTLDGPAAGIANFHRGGDLGNYDAETRRALQGHPEEGAALTVWEAALASPAQRVPVWVHGDVAPGNVLVRDGRVAALIDFGQVCIGDPACDLTMVWTLFEGEARRAFVQGLHSAPQTWARARGWALWKAAITDPKGPVFHRILTETGEPI